MRCTIQGVDVLFVVNVMTVIMVGTNIGAHDNCQKFYLNYLVKSEVVRLN
jgi:hypothetical protein